MSAVTSATSYSTSIHSIHKKRTCDRFIKCFWNAVHLTTAIVTEIIATLQSMIILHKGKKKVFQYYNLNPSKLSAKEADQPAILFLHGLYHNQTGALALAKKLQKEGIGPFFSANFKYNTKKIEKNHKQLRARMKEIRALYAAKGKPVRFILIGHSYGTKTAIEQLDIPLKNCTIEKVISIAGRIRADKSCHHSLKPQIAKVEKIIKKHPEVALHHIVAGKDYLLSKYSAAYYTDKEHCHVVKNRSHLGVLDAKETLEKTVEFLQA